MIVADAEEAAKAQNGVRDLAGDLVDHDAFDRSNLGVAGAIDGGSFHLVAADQGSGFSCFRNHRCSSIARERATGAVTNCSWTFGWRPTIRYVDDDGRRASRHPVQGAELVAVGIAQIGD